MGFVDGSFIGCRRPLPVDRVKKSGSKERELGLRRKGLIVMSEGGEDEG